MPNAEKCGQSYLAVKVPQKKLLSLSMCDNREKDKIQYMAF
jgi:hypothetical protein